ncbi:CDGSH iron-sulfur domain-containing protein 1-like [Diceros bicornis minor]|uniref:CDGSH iron-sulfur domain-containing protein 1-like n=1 Tax=Diceros bicornis minor TaxID=77932 RepID=UPI0026F2BF98|nr:CDGSH iron-sulfur domain-containing protein 1-like [Diceros bicornis minor]
MTPLAVLPTGQTLQSEDKGLFYHYFNIQWSLTSSVQVEWIAAARTAATCYLTYKRFCVQDHCSKSMVNLYIQDSPKTVRAFVLEHLGDKAVHCHGWRSKKCSFCDGSHTTYNEETGDNMGLLLPKKKRDLNGQFWCCKPTCHGVT